MLEFRLAPSEQRAAFGPLFLWVDRATLARETIAKDGLTYTDRLANIRKHPAVSIAEAATIAFARLTRELSLTDTTPDENRPPSIKSNSGY